jgi:hypothetical protein
MGMGVNPYPPVYMGDPMGLFLCRGYGYGVVTPGGYLPIAISSQGARVGVSNARRQRWGARAGAGGACARGGACGWGQAGHELVPGVRGRGQAGSRCSVDALFTLLIE